MAFVRSRELFLNNVNTINWNYPFHEFLNNLSLTISSDTLTYRPRFTNSHVSNTTGGFVLHRCDQWIDRIDHYTSFDDQRILGVSGAPGIFAPVDSSLSITASNSTVATGPSNSQDQYVLLLL